jgi:hypothetical protein
MPNGSGQVIGIRRTSGSRDRFLSLRSLLDYVDAIRSVVQAVVTRA